MINVSDFCRSENKKHVVVCMNKASVDMKLLSYSKETDSWNVLDLTECSEFVMPLDNDMNDTYPLGLALDTTNTICIPGKPLGKGNNHLAPVILVYTNECNIIPLFYDVNVPPLTYAMTKRHSMQKNDNPVVCGPGVKTSPIDSSLTESPAPVEKPLVAKAELDAVTPVPKTIGKLENEDTFTKSNYDIPNEKQRRVFFFFFFF